MLIYFIKLKAPVLNGTKSHILGARVADLWTTVYVIFSVFYFHLCQFIMQWLPRCDKQPFLTAAMCFNAFLLYLQASAKLLNCVP